MTDAPAPLANCRAAAFSEGFMACERCGLAWPADQAKPACAPMSPKALRMALLSEAAALEGSHHAVVQMADAGMPADPADALARAMRLRCVLLFLDRCVGSPAIVAELRRIAERAQADG